MRYSEILNKISKKHGAKPTAPRPIEAGAFERPDLGTHVNLPAVQGPGQGPPGFAQEPTQEISRGIMSKIFQKALSLPEDAATSLPPSLSPGGLTPAPRPVRNAGEDPPAAPREVRLFRNKAELIKFASLLINEIEDRVGGQAG